jgi:hypothetical protein
MILITGRNAPMTSFTRRALLAAMLAALSTPVAAQTANLTGKWLFTVETSAGGGTPTITLKQDGEKLTGHYTGQLGESDLTGTVKGQDVTFTFAVEVQGTRLVCTYAGSVENKDSLKGTVKIAPLGDGTFTARRE